jgi:hypothetical protein
MNTANKRSLAHLPLRQSIVAWSSSSIEGGPMVNVFHTCDPFDVPDEFLCTWGACNFDVHGLTDHERLKRLFGSFIDLVVHSGIPPKEAHSAFLKITEYRECASS